jgi:integrase
MSPVNSSARSHPSIADPESPTGQRATVIALVPKPKKASAPARVPTGFYKRGEVWYFRRKIDGVQINVSTGFADLKRAERFAEDCVRAQREGDLGWTTQTMPTVGQYFTDIEPKVSKRVAAFVEAHKHLRLNRVDDNVCRKWVTTRSEANTQYDRPFASGTVRVECAILKAWFQRVVGQKKLLRVNPWKGVKLPKKSVKKRYLRSGDEEKRLFDALVTFDAEIVRAVKILIGSGLRIAEFLSTRPRDVQNGIIGVRSEYAKGGYSRNVPVHATVIAEIEAQREARGLEPFSTECLFNLPYNNVRDRLKRACDLAGIEKITPHDLRRTYGTRMAFKVPAKVLQLLMGHKQISTTFEHYNVAEEDTLGALVASAGQIV